MCGYVCASVRTCVYLWYKMNVSFICLSVLVNNVKVILLNFRKMSKIIIVLWYIPEECSTLFVSMDVLMRLGSMESTTHKAKYVLCLLVVGDCGFWEKSILRDF